MADILVESKVKKYAKARKVFKIFETDMVIEKVMELQSWNLKSSTGE